MLAFLFELGIVILFSGCFCHAARHGRLFFLLFLCINAFIFEALAMHMYHAVAYTGSFHAVITDIPIAIILGWAALLYGVLQFTDNITIKNKPLLNGLILVGVDSVLDPLAVRAGLWNWNLPAGFLGIPYDNFFAWLLFGILVSYVARKLLHNRPSLLQSVVATIKLHVIGVPLGFAWFAYASKYQAILFWTLVAVAAAVVTVSYFRREYLK